MRTIDPTTSFGMTKRRRSGYLFTWQVWNSNRTIDPTTAFGVKSGKYRKLCHLDPRSDSGCVIGLQIWNGKFTLNPTTAIGMIIGEIVNFVISTQGEIWLCDGLANLEWKADATLRSGWQSGEDRQFVYLASLEWKAYYRSHHCVRDDKVEKVRLFVYLANSEWKAYYISHHFIRDDKVKF